MTISAGSRLGPYEIVAPIGAGGMGEVFKARDTRLDRMVAIKVLPLEFADNALQRQRLEREAKMISQLNHPHICALYDVGDGYLVMELHEMATGRRAFEGKSKGSIIASILTAEAPVISAIHTVPAAFERVVRTCLQKDPEERFQSAHDVRLELQWMQQSAAEMQSQIVSRRPWSALLLLLAAVSISALA